MTGTTFSFNSGFLDTLQIADFSSDAKSSRAQFDGQSSDKKHWKLPQNSGPAMHTTQYVAMAYVHIDFSACSSSFFISLFLFY